VRLVYRETSELDRVPETRDHEGANEPVDGRPIVDGATARRAAQARSTERVEAVVGVPNANV
jgi:hypothetical protein